MPRQLLFGLMLLIICGLAPLAASPDAPAPAGPGAPGGPAAPAAHVDVLFSPNGGCEQRVVAELVKAAKTIRVQAFTFTSPVIARTLADARARGVDCEVILDKSHRTDKFSIAPTLRAAGVPCLIDQDHMVANNKVILIDGVTLLTGSYNYTRAAESSNAENLLIIKDMPEVLKAYTENYARHRQHARPFDQPAVAGQAVVGCEAGPAGEVPAPDAPAPGESVYVTARGKRYHRAGCEFLYGTGRALQRSEIQGQYTPCSKCRP